METIGLLILFFGLIYVLSPKKKSLVTYVYFEDETKVSMKVLTNSIRETKPSTYFYIGMFTGSEEDALQIKNILERQKNHYKKPA